MATLQSIIDTVVDTTSRPDLETVLKTEIAKALVTAHATEKFTRDLKLQYITNPVVVNGAVTINTSLDLTAVREIYGDIKLYSSFTSSGSPAVITPGTPIQHGKFKSITDASAGYDYYGFRYLNTWAQIGSTITINGVDPATTCIEIPALVWPVTSINNLGVLTTTSWIPDNHSCLLEAYLRKYVATKSKDKDMLNDARQDILLYSTQLTKTEPLLRSVYND
jgi:hypothetical protein